MFNLDNFAYNLKESCRKVNEDRAKSDIQGADLSHLATSQSFIQHLANGDLTDLNVIRELAQVLVASMDYGEPYNLPYVPGLEAVRHLQQQYIDNQK